MTQLRKAHWQIDDKTIHLGVEFSKINKAKRLVSGWATLDNVDTEGDVVTAEASADAFARARGNLREMHKKDSAVGRIVSFKEDEFRAPDGKNYRGIFVTARVSEGAENTWLKVLDGTLSGFSIGGNIVEADEEFNKDSGIKVRKVKKYDLNELSLVDNPGNQYANVFRIQKSVDGSVTAISGMVEEHRIYNVFFCDEDKLTQEKPDDAYDCPVCSEKMELIGFIEDGSDRDAKAGAIVKQYLGGGETMTKANTNGTTDETVETGHEAGDPTEVPTPTEGAADVEEVTGETDEPAEVEEVQDEADEIAKKIDSLKADIGKIVSDANADTHAKIASLEKSLKDTREFFDTKITEFDAKLDGVNTSLETAKSRQIALEGELRKINSASAFKKSVDSDELTETVQKSETSTWGGAFSDPRQSGAFSVDNLLR